MKDFISELEKRGIPRAIKMAIESACSIYEKNGNFIDDETLNNSKKECIKLSLQKDEKLAKIFSEFACDYTLTAVVKELDIHADDLKTKDPKIVLKELIDKVFD